MGLQREREQLGEAILPLPVAPIGAEQRPLYPGHGPIVTAGQVSVAALKAPPRDSLVRTSTRTRVLQAEERRRGGRRRARDRRPGRAGRRTHTGTAQAPEWPHARRRSGAWRCP